jgi:hypothetical protein
MERFVAFTECPGSATPSLFDFIQLPRMGNYLTLSNGSGWIKPILVVDSLCFAFCDRSFL